MASSSISLMMSPMYMYSYSAEGRPAEYGPDCRELPMVHCYLWRVALLERNTPPSTVAKVVRLVAPPLRSHCRCK